jgi:hypothetical protein
MSYQYDIILRSPSSERSFRDEYFFVRTSKQEYFRVPNRYGFNAVSFLVGCKDYNYPVVFDDYTTNSHVDPLEEVTYKDVPPVVKRKFTNWAKYQ